MNRPQSTISYGSSISSNPSTIWGPGTLTGKALEAFGEATLRGVENLAIRRKLASFRSVFPHKNDTTIENIELIYDDVLEISRLVPSYLIFLTRLRACRGIVNIFRPHLYSKAVGRAARQLLIVQINSRENHHLIKALDGWPQVEVRFFLSEIMSFYMGDSLRSITIFCCFQGIKLIVT
jgi:hypothetical protein